MSTPTERRIVQKRKAAKTGAILVPILEELLEKEVIPEDEEDFAFLDMLVRARAMPRAKGVFSPSMIGSCVRQAWFSKRGERKVNTFNPQTNGYFLKGNFVHLQWQFALWKAHRKRLLRLIPVPAESEELEMFSGGLRPAVECRVSDGDMTGTIDAIVQINKVNHVVDFKGINVIDFQRTVKNGAKPEYRKQIVGYGMIARKQWSLTMGDCLLVSESKAGPIHGSSPIALHETRVPIEEFEGEVNRRLKTLSYFDHHNEVPEPECQSTRHMSFQECPFSRHCFEEVRAIQRERERGAKEQRRNWQVARP